MADSRVSSRTLLPLLVLFAAVGPLALNLPLPAVPGLGRYFEADASLVQLVITLYLAGTAVSQLVLGPLSDRYGRRPVMLVSMALTVVMSIAAALATSIGWLIVARVLQSVGASAGQVVGRAIVRDLYDRDHAASMIGWITMAMVIGPMVAPSMGGLLNETVGWRWIFVAAALMAAVSAVAGLAFLPETRRAAASPSLGELWRDAGALMRDRAFLGYLGVASLSSVTFFAFVGGAPHVVVSLMGESSTVYGLWFMVNAGGYILGNAVSGRYSVRFGADRLMAVGCVLMALAVVVQCGVGLAGWMVAPAMLFVPQAAIAFANGLQLPGAIAGAVGINPNTAGSASGIVGFAQMGVGALAAQAAGMLVGLYESPIPMLLIVTAGGLASYACLALLRGRTAVRD